VIAHSTNVTHQCQFQNLLAITLPVIDSPLRISSYRPTTGFLRGSLKVDRQKNVQLKPNRTTRLTSS